MSIFWMTLSVLLMCTQPQAFLMYKRESIHCFICPVAFFSKFSDVAALLQDYIIGGLARKTVVLVTHQVEFLPAFDSIQVSII
jgi:hypothetical protein